MCHNPKGLRPGLDRHLDEIQSKSDTDDRTMLRVCFWLLSNIGRSMPWDRLQGIDAKRFNPDTNAVAPSWRDCIGAILGLSYDPPEGFDADHPNPEEDLNEEDVPDDPTEQAAE